MRQLCAVALVLISLPAQAEITVRKGQGIPAPTQPVISNNLEAPVFQSDVRNLEAILDKEENARVTRDPQKAAKVPPTTATITVPASAATSEPAPSTADEEGFISSMLMGIRVFAIRWRDLIDIVFTGVMLFYVRKLYILSREQHKILSHSIRSAEYSASAAKRSADICEFLLQSQQKPDEAQQQLDLR